MGAGAGAGATTYPRGDRDGGRPVQQREAAPHHVTARMEDAQCRFGQLFVVVEMDGGQGGDVQVPLLVAYQLIYFPKSKCSTASLIGNI